MENHKTSLYDEHVDLKARMVPFAGYLMPVQYTSIKDEHLWVREHAGIFDVSHMGEMYVKGNRAYSFLQSVITNNLEKISQGKCLYTLICHENGFILDDVIVYWIGATEFMIVVNASNKFKIFEWLKQKQAEFKIREEDLSIADQSETIDLIALQGQRASSVLKDLGFSVVLEDMELFSLKFTEYHQHKILVSKTGYTGETGVEIFSFDKELSKELWRELLKHSSVRPIGLGARDTLRLEVCFPLYGHELNEETNPFEAGLHFAIDINKSDFVGKKALESQQGKERKKIFALRAIDKGILREGYTVYKDGLEIGRITSGSYLPSLDFNGGLAYLTQKNLMIGDTVEVLIRQNMINCEIIQKPFIQPYYRRK